MANTLGSSWTRRPFPVPARKLKSASLMLVTFFVIWFIVFRCFRNNEWKNQKTKAERLNSFKIRNEIKDYDDHEVEGMLSIMATDDITTPSIIQRGGDDFNEIIFRPQAPIYVPPLVLVHLDFKGAPPKVSYLQQLLPLLSNMGATGLLIEYEDMFPYWGKLTQLSAYNAYTYEEVREILTIAKKSKLEVIPLIQTFGHMEFVLKSVQFKGLREVSSYPQAICPSKGESMALIKEMIDQTISMHPDIRYIHLGCDEVFHLGKCTKCKHRLANISRTDYLQNTNSFLFLNHVHSVASYVKMTYPGVQSIVWDDMFRTIPAKYIVRNRLNGGLVEPMIWSYSTEIRQYITQDILNKYADVFPHVWAAGAFKGAFGETNFLPDVYRHALNTAEWLSVMRQESVDQFVKFRGLVLTGWQRYDHFSVLCELLPVAVPSLAITLLTTINGRLETSVLNNASVNLGCPVDNADITVSSKRRTSQTPLTLETLQNDKTLVRQLAGCIFPGSDIFHSMRILVTTKTQFTKYLRKITQEDGWLTLYNTRRNISNPYRVNEVSKRTKSSLRSITWLKKRFKIQLETVFDMYTVNEWIEQQIEPMLVALRLVETKMKPILARDTWPRRPLT